MSCKHLIWNCYCKYKQDFCERKLFSRLCEDYCREDEVEDMKKILNKGPVININCASNESTNFRFVLTLILGYLDKLDSIAIINCDDPKSYFKDKVSEVLVPNLTDAVNKTRLYVKASKDNWLAEGMRMVEQWFEELAKENIPPKELTIADIEKQLGYKIKIVGETNE